MSYQSSRVCTKSIRENLEPHEMNLKMIENKVNQVSELTRRVEPIKSVELGEFGHNQLVSQAWPTKKCRTKPG